ncbi:MAG: nuclear transport factor 2 family protein [Alphaproteobacteria bacterium]|nr:nuclear transport factor 2 family protein [Alphaproteobacteria bacterium]
MTQTRDRLEAAADRDEIYQLSCTYMRGQDRLDPEAHRSVFWDDAYLSYGIYEGGPDGFVEFAQDALRPHKSNHHMIGQVQIELEGDEAFGEVYYQAFHRIEDEDGNERDLFVSGRYVDRYERRGGVWKIAYRSELVDWVRDDPAADEWFKDSGMIPGARKPDDPLYDREAMRKKS